MSANSTTTAPIYSAPDGWDYGDTVYGLEPLILPPPGSQWVPDQRSDVVEDRYADLLTGLRTAHWSDLPPAAEGDLEALFWFRWITGHHISFILWQFLADSLPRLGGDERAGSAPSIAGYVRGYSAALLYTSSCTREIYSATIRPSMYRLHPGFSGTWASDYPAVRSVFRGRRLPAVGPGETERLEREVALSSQVHMGIASRLVPSGRSLFQEAIARSGARKSQFWSALFDCYFITLRAPTSAEQLLAQLLRRCKAVVLDLTANGLYPAAAAYPEDLPDELSTASVRALERDLVEIMADVAGLATAHAASTR